MEEDGVSWGDLVTLAKILLPEWCWFGSGPIINVH